MTAIANAFSTDLVSASGLDIFESDESSVRSYCRSFPETIESALGSIQVSTTGKEYIDFFAGAGALNYGHNEPSLKKALLDYISKDGIAHGLDFKTQAKGQFIQTFKDQILTPRGLDYKLQFTGPTGTNAVEAAIKLARKVTGRHNIIAFTNAFHGMSLGSLALTTNPKKRDAGGVHHSNVSFLPYENYLGENIDSAEVARKLLRPGSGVDRPAAFILETIQGEGGVNTATRHWTQAIASLAKEVGALLIVDDIQAGCGRTTDFFSFESLGVNPDIVTLSKSLSGYGLPMSLVLIKPHLDVWEPGEHNGTFRGNNLAFVTAQTAVLKYWSTNEFSNSLKVTADALDKKLRGFQNIGSVIDNVKLKGRGLFRGIEFTRPGLASKVSRAAFAEGLIIETSGIDDQVLKFLPPLNISIEHLDLGFEKLETAFKKLQRGHHD